MPVTIREMTDEEYVSFFRWSIQSQAKDLIEEGACSWEDALAMAEKDAMEAGCREVVLFVTDRNTAAKALYEKSGYRVLRQAGYGKYLSKHLA